MRQERCDMRKEGCDDCPIRQIDYEPQRLVWWSVVESTLDVVDEVGRDGFTSPPWYELGVKAKDGVPENAVAVACLERQIGRLGVTNGSP
jgi:hypothetical protein